jgi:hypothetical protein
LSKQGEGGGSGAISLSILKLEVIGSLGGSFGGVSLCTEECFKSATKSEYV